MKLENKVAFITGAGHGQGASHAKYLAREGAKIVAVDICEDIKPIYPLATREELDATVAAVEGIGSEAIAIQADVRSSAQMRDAVATAVDRFGTIDILCNNAGVCIVEAVDEISDESLDAVIDVCLKGIFNTMRFIAPIMKAQGSGKVINTSSAGGLKALPQVSHYAAAKGGVVLATKSWANELSEWGINVNGIAPGTIYTGMITGIAGQLGVDSDVAFVDFNANNMFKGERGHVTVDDISSMVVYLASDEARMITGQVFPVDAGWVSS
ncbi:3-ketoacyl-ACP reductase [Pseudonocardia sulfidoxydans NBRC 16205]|uniref:3-ketoacyl-ACP reductase n=1 Tax=Pseudonocardia sulfidoxydans NBRC 16205 TaxID=1223511 RepID=A0A511D9V7_9PSEU|nr:SDR family NAD(P)-dependent oxidoreductase [Pseudonocardia sulfidoxydans]GEL21561.1 3-ketoacyl-ACP reductase [Pseudonocardia sulfidoxydans NBRC 16205]